MSGAFFILTTLSLFLTGQCHKSYELSGPSWKNQIKKCASGGSDDHTYTFNIGHLDSLGLPYKEIDSLTTVVAFGTIEGYTKALGYLTEKLLYLHEYEEKGSYKQFSNSWGYTAVCGWAKQICSIKIAVKIMSSGDMELTNYVYAASWGAVTCAETKCFVDKLQIIN